MAELDFTTRQALVELNTPIELPARYDDLTVDQRARVRDDYARRQRGICPLCLQPLLADPPPVIRRLKVDKMRWPPEFFKWPQHLHHNHRTGLTIGTYHARCNAVLACYFNE